MTTNACLGSLIGPEGGMGFTTTATDDTITEAVDNVSSLSLYKVLLGKLITHFMFSYTAGSGTFFIYNTVSRQIKALECGTMPKGLNVQPLEQPFTVEQGDILYLYTTAAGT